MSHAHTSSQSLTLQLIIQIPDLGDPDDTKRLNVALWNGASDYQPDARPRHLRAAVYLSHSRFPRDLVKNVGTNGYLQADITIDILYPILTADMMPAFLMPLQMRQFSKPPREITIYHSEIDDEYHHISEQIMWSDLSAFSQF
jgi:hypothetical protein